MELTGKIHVSWLEENSGIANCVFRKGRISLDHKLRLASHVHDKVTEYLTDLETALETGISNLHHLIPFTNI